MVWGSLIGAGISAGASLLGGSKASKNAKKAAQLNYEHQKEFAQHGISWKAADARRAGLHPYFAMGGSATSFAPSVVGDTALPSAIASAGQDIGRAVSAGSTRGTRDSQYHKTLQDLTVKKFGLENELLASQIAKMRGQIGPPMPTVGRDPLLMGRLKLTPRKDESSHSALENEYGEGANLVSFSRMLRDMGNEYIRVGRSDWKKTKDMWRKRNKFRRSSQPSVRW